MVYCMTMVFFQIGEFWVASDHVGSTLQRDRLCHTNLFLGQRQRKMEANIYRSHSLQFDPCTFNTGGSTVMMCRPDPYIVLDKVGCRLPSNPRGE
jgi:hypothetical protein